MTDLAVHAGFLGAAVAFGSIGMWARWKAAVAALEEVTPAND